MSSALIREAVHEGRRVALLRCVDGPEGATIVEVEVVSAGTGGPITRGPYSFRTAHEAFQFVQEATLALQYLGCTVGSP